MKARLHWLGRTMAALALFAGASCSTAPDRSADEHEVYFVGYVYDGAKGARLTNTQLTSVSIKYRDKVVKTKIEDDGRFVTLDPLPTWQDYAVYVNAPGFRPFVSRNTGIDVPESLAMTDGLAGAKTTQTFQVDAYLFPEALKASKATITIDQPDDLMPPVAGMPVTRASGTIRLRPVAGSVVGIGQNAATSGRRWANDEDLLTTTLVRDFTGGKVEIADGELTYGVSYEITIYNVKGHQPEVLQDRLVAGLVTSRSVTLKKELKTPLRLLSTNADSCMLPTFTNEFGGEIKLTFSEEIEAVGTTFEEEIDNGLSVVGISMTGSTSVCSLKSSIDPKVRERGTRVLIQGSTMSLAFNPVAGTTTMNGSLTCALPVSYSSITYGGLGNISLAPKGDLARKRTLSTMLSELQQQGVTGISTTAISCPVRASQF